MQFYQILNNLTSYYSIPKIKQFLDENGINLSKRRGQNFLLDKNILKKIVQASNISIDDFVIEIGGGIGHLTSFLANTGAKVLVFEIDKKLAKILNDRFKDYPNIQIVCNDFLKVTFEDFIHSSEKIKIVANVPYSITSPILEKCFINNSYIKSMTLTVQKEFGERIVALYGTANYSSLSVICQVYSTPKLLFTVSNSVFYPVPEVNSVVVNFDLSNNKRIYINNNDLFLKMIKAIFTSRRKTLFNSLKNNPFISFTKDQINKSFDECSLSSMVRGEELSPDLMIKLANTLLKFNVK